MFDLKALFARSRPFMSTNARNFTTMPEKSSESRYSAISSDDDSQTSEHDDLLPQYSSKSSSKSSISHRSKLLITAGSLLVFALYSAICVGLTTLYWKGERVHGANVVDTPLRKHMIYEPTNMHIGESTADYTLMAHPSDEVDQAWAELLQDFFTEVPYSYVEKVGRLDTSVKTENGFVATYTFMHQLHCLKRLHQSYWPERYFPNTTKEEDASLLEHNLHCLQMMLKAIMCHADTVPETIRWVKESPYPFGDRSSPHECVNWDVLMAEMKRNRVDPTTPGVFVHPIYGNALPDGRATVIPHKFSLGFIIGGTTVKTGSG